MESNCPVTDLTVRILFHLEAILWDKLHQNLMKKCLFKSAILNGDLRVWASSRYLLILHCTVVFCFGFVTWRDLSGCLLCISWRNREPFFFSGYHDRKGAWSGHSLVSWKNTLLILLFLPARFATTQGVTKLFITYLEEVFLRGLLHLLKIYSSRVSKILPMKTLNSLGKAR